MLNNETIYELTQGIEFIGYEHMMFYCENVIKTKSERDVYRKAFFYTLGILVTTRTNIDSLYDFQSQTGSGKSGKQNILLNYVDWQ